ncbi:MAG TPA: hypothetical protein VJS66_06550, partial [Burkholderiales bacterium]|nr:hypothetical protein [Burkholderiales bacterium]
YDANGFVQHPVLCGYRSDGLAAELNARAGRDVCGRIHDGNPIDTNLAISDRLLRQAAAQPGGATQESIKPRSARVQGRANAGMGENTMIDVERVFISGVPFGSIGTF